MVRRQSVRAWQCDAEGHRIGRSASKKKPLDEGSVGGVTSRHLLLMQHEPVQLGSIGVQDQEADVGLGCLMQDIHQ